MTQIHILDRDINVAYNMATLIAYEQITDKAYNPADLDRTENRLSLLYAAILSANRGTDLEMADLLEKANNADIRTLDEAVSKEMLAFYKIPTPSVSEEEEQTDTNTKDDNSKNA